MNRLSLYPFLYIHMFSLQHAAAIPYMRYSISSQLLKLLNDFSSTPQVSYNRNDIFYPRQLAYNRFFPCDKEDIQYRSFRSRNKMHTTYKIRILENISLSEFLHNRLCQFVDLFQQTVVFYL